MPSDSSSLVSDIPLETSTVASETLDAEVIWETMGPETDYTWQPVSERLQTPGEAHAAEYMRLLQRCGLVSRWQSVDVPPPLGVCFRRGRAYYAMTPRMVELFLQYPQPPNPFAGYTIDEIAALIAEYRSGGAA